ncbi:MAG: DUF86 domain-containing protein [Armatimonadetes bacterium]|nr:DUF86 domain-containing protein [Armatimonadota bacterium]
MVDEIEKIQRHTSGSDLASFEQDEVLQGDVIYRIGILGEAAANIPDELKARYPDIPWTDIRRFRNFVTHVYFGLVSARIWRVVSERLVPLREQLLALMQAEGLQRD